MPALFGMLPHFHRPWNSRRKARKKEYQPPSVRTREENAQSHKNSSDMRTRPEMISRTARTEGTSQAPSTKEAQAPKMLQQRISSTPRPGMNRQNSQ